MILNRRSFFEKVAAFGLGFFVMVKGSRAWAKGLPSDPGTSSGETSGPDVIALPPFEKNSPFTLDQALLDRKSTKRYDANRPLPMEAISRLLWATCGVNGLGAHRTIASAYSRFPTAVFVALPTGVFLFEPSAHSLRRVIPEDIRPVINSQPWSKDAGMSVLYVIDTDKVPPAKIEWVDIEIGSMGQNLYLEATALGLGSCWYSAINFGEVTRAVGLKKNQMLRIAQAVGHILA